MSKTTFTTPEGEFSIPAPNGLCDLCVQTATQKHHQLDVAICYCEHHHAAGILYLGASPAVWRITQPISREIFLEQILTASLELERAFQPSH